MDGMNQTQQAKLPSRRSTIYGCMLPSSATYSTSLFSVKLPPLTKHPIPPSIKKEQNKNPKQDKIHKRIKNTKQTKPIHTQIKVQILMENQLHKQTFHHQQTVLQSQLKLHTFFFLFSCLLINSSANSYMFIYGGCSQDKYQPDSPFETNLNSLLSSIVSSSSQSSYNSFAVGNGTSSAPLDAPAAAAVPAYGLYQCRGDLKISECSSCVQNAVGQIHLVCPSAYAAGLELDGCFIRYENVDFLGKLDTSILYKKCSRSTSNDVEFFKRRDDVLADLESTTSFRVSSLGLVEGFAQCLGDLNPNDCSSCISDAVGKLKNICGSASAADVYLGQCYARYWASGYYGSREDSSSEDQVGKTVAIIAGTLAALALIVVLLSFCRKAMG